MSAPPPCSALGRQCRELKVLLRIGSLEEGEASLDHEATWLLGHTERISFGAPWDAEGELYVDAVLHVPCKHLEAAADGRAHCRAHGFRGRMPREGRRLPQPLRLGGDRFTIVEGMQRATRTLPYPRKALPVVEGPLSHNPCEGAPCETSDHKRGAGCCRDLQVEIMCTKRQARLEALVRSRKAPYLCKVERAGDYSLEAEMISACDYLVPGGVACTLHGRARPDGRTAKPDLCFEWPPSDPSQVLHVGCVFRRRRR